MSDTAIRVQNLSKRYRIGMNIPYFTVVDSVILVVNEDGDILALHPKTGEILDIEHIETGRIKVESIKEKTSTAKIIKESSAGEIAYGQLVRSAVEKSSGEREIGFYSLPPEGRQERLKREKARGRIEAEAG